MDPTDAGRSDARFQDEAMAPVLAILEKMGSHPGNHPGNGTSENREGSGVCPNGKPGPKGNPNHTGN